MRYTEHNRNNLNDGHTPGSYITLQIYRLFNRAQNNNRHILHQAAREIYQGAKDSIDQATQGIYMVYIAIKQIVWHRNPYPLRLLTGIFFSTYVSAARETTSSMSSYQGAKDSIDQATQGIYMVYVAIKQIIWHRNPYPLLLLTGIFPSTYVSAARETTSSMSRMYHLFFRLNQNTGGEGIRGRADVTQDNLDFSAPAPLRASMTHNDRCKGQNISFTRSQ